MGHFKKKGLMFLQTVKLPGNIIILTPYICLIDRWNYYNGQRKRFQKSDLVHKQFYFI
jgi:hypothetical protein